jgi:ATP-dependent DNA helicase RecG
MNLNTLLRELTALPSEVEWVEFKCNNQNPEEMGEYLSALANAAALLRKDRAYLVWGIEDATHKVVGTSFKPRQMKKGNEELENWLGRLLQPRLDFRVHEFAHEGKPVVLFEVPAASHTPVRFSGEEFIRVGSYKKKLKDYPEKERALWAIFQKEDWSAQLLPGASLEDLDPEALVFARQEYAKKQPRLAAEAKQWDDRTFLNKAKLCVQGKVTRTAIILLGRSEAEHFLSPAIARVSWVLKGEGGVEKDYRHFGPPLILAVNQVFGLIRNLTYRYLPNASLFPTEVTQYDPWVIRETLHNSIAHEDYTQAGRINVVEEPDSLLFTNLGEFLPGSVEEVIRRDSPPDFYRNRSLAEAMVNLNMIDTIGSGIKRMFRVQRQRFFPMPDYDLKEPGRVKVRIIGKVMDEKYTRMLMNRSDLELMDVIALDKVQKRRPLTDEEFRTLKGKLLIEGRRPNLFVSAEVAAATETRADYIKKRAFDKGHYKKMVLAYLGQYGHATTEEIRKLLRDKVSDALSAPQKLNWIRNLLGFMSREDGTIRHEGPKRGGRWVLANAPTEGVASSQKMGAASQDPGQEPPISS